MKKNKFKNDLTIWTVILAEATKIAKIDITAKNLFDNYIYQFDSFEQSFTYLILEKLNPIAELKKELEKNILLLLKNKKNQSLIFSDLIATYERDPACNTPLYPYLFYKGFHALTVYRIANQLWKKNMHTLALYLQSLSSKVFTIDIHPAAQISNGIFIDHGHGIVIGETCKIKNGVSILQEVTLGGTGKESGDRHPKIESGVLIGAGAKILGNIRIGKCSKIGASSVVLKDIPPYSVAVGIPAKVVAIIKELTDSNPAQTMDHSIN